MEAPHYDASRIASEGIEIVFNIGKTAGLCRMIDVDERILMETLDDFDTNPDAIVRELTLWPADPTKKPRDIIAIRGQWRRIQRRLYSQLLLPRLIPSKVSHGGVKERDPTTNAKAHLGNQYAYVTDVSGFYPSISIRRVNSFFLDQRCSPKVASVLTRLCTYDYHLAIGLITSPILANEMFKSIDLHIARACRKMKLTYTRFVDDLTISGMYDLRKSGVHGVVEDIVARHGFKLAEAKTDWGKLDGDIAITGIRLKNRHLDASKQYVAELERTLADHASLAVDGEFNGPLLTEGEMFGKCHFVCRVNPGRRRSIFSKLKTIKWDALFRIAVDRELVRRRKCFRDRPQINYRSNSLISVQFHNSSRRGMRFV
jgi:RNA-directed DNA polymerase